MFLDILFNILCEFTNKQLILSDNWGEKEF